MNPVLQTALGSILRAGLVFLAGFLVRKGIWTSGEADVYVTALVLFLLGLGWSLWQKYQARIKFMAALHAPAGTTENGINAMIKSGVVTPTIFTPPDTIPGVPATTTTPPQP